MRKPLCVLFVEDDENDMLLVVHELRRGGYDPVCERVETPMAMHAALDRTRWDLVIADYTMPQFDASAALALLQERGLDLPFIIVSGTIGEERAVAIMKAGAHDYIVKNRLARLVPAIARELREASERTARRQAELSLHESEERFRRLAENAPDMIYRYLLTSTPGFDYISPAAMAITGYTPQEYHADSDLRVKLIHPDDRGRFESLWQAPAAGGTPFTIRCVRKDGVIIWTEQRITPITDAAGTITAIEGIVRDITERRRAARRLAAQYAASRVLIESANLDGAASRLLQTIGEGLEWDLGEFWTVDQHADTLHCTTTWNAPMSTAAAFEVVSRQQSFSSDIGLPGRVWANGEPVWVADLRTERDFPGCAAMASAGLQSALAFPVQSGSGVLGVIVLFSYAIRPLDEGLIQLVAALGHQIGQFVERTRAEAALRESEARKGAILATALDCIITIDHTGRITEFNPAAEQTFGYRRDEVLGQPLAELIVPTSLRAMHRKGLAHYLLTGEGSVIGKRIEITAVRADGDEFPIELAITRIPTNGPPLFTGFVRDITARKQAEEKFRLVVEASPSGIVLVNPAGQIVLVNSQTEKLFGYTREELIGQPIELLVPERLRRAH
ncbi:MAG TPA: PAS domain S-box protein, partial [Roseiflexaceae bacterium]